jgi:hypothetical protein
MADLEDLYDRTFHPGAYEKLLEDVRDICSGTAGKVIAGRCNPAPYTKGCHDAVTNTLPLMIADSTARAKALEHLLSVAIDKIGALTIQNGILLDRLAEIEDLVTRPQQ